MTSGLVTAHSWPCRPRMAIALLCPLTSWSLARLWRSGHSWISSPHPLPVRKRAREHRVADEQLHPCPAPTLPLSRRRKRLHLLPLKRSERHKAWRPNLSPGALPSKHWRDGANPAPQSLLPPPLLCPVRDCLLPKLPQAHRLPPSVPETLQHLKDPPLGNKATQWSS